MYNNFDEARQEVYDEIRSEFNHHRTETKIEKIVVTAKPTVTFKNDKEKEFIEEKTETDPKMLDGLVKKLKGLSFPQNNNMIDYLAIVEDSDRKSQTSYYIEIAKRAVMMCSAGRKELASQYETEAYVNKLVSDNHAANQIIHQIEKAHSMVFKSWNKHKKTNSYPILPGSFLRLIELSNTKEGTLSKGYHKVEITNKEISYVCYRITRSIMEKTIEDNNQYSYLSETYLLKMKDGIKKYTGKSIYHEKLCRIIRILKDLSLISVKENPIKGRCTAYEMGPNNPYKYYDIHGWIDQVVSARKSV